MPFKHLVFKYPYVVLIALAFIESQGVVHAMDAEQREAVLSEIRRLKSDGNLVYALVPKVTPNSFFEEAARGCEDEARRQGVYCFYFGDTVENARIQESLIQDLIGVNVDGIAVSAISKDWIANQLGTKIQNWGGAFVAFDSPINTSLADVFIGTENYEMGRVLGLEIAQLKPEGGTFCIQSSRPDSPNHQQRVEGILDGLIAGAGSTQLWQQGFGCPVYYYEDITTAHRQMTKMFSRYDVDTFLITGGGPQFNTVEYRSAVSPFLDKMESGDLVIGSMDTTPEQLSLLKDYYSTINIGQRPYDMGVWSVKAMQSILKEETVPQTIITGVSICTRDTVEVCNH